MRIILSVIGILMFFFLPVLNLNAAETPSLKEDMRLPWALTQGDYLRDWLVVGGFPNPDGHNFDFDFLSANQGETGITPTTEMSYQLEDRTTVKWTRHISPYNYINFMYILKDINLYNTIAYAYTTVNRPQAGKVILSFGSTVGYKIWINGKVAAQSQFGGPVTENDQIEVEMVKGENSILMKSIHGGWTWGFTMRVVEPEFLSLIHDIQLAPAFSESKINNQLVIKTDKALSPEIQKIDVTVTVVAAGGKVVAEKTVKRGAMVSFETASWPEGVLDIRLKSKNNKGQLITEYLTWYKGDALKKANELIAAVPKNPESPAEMTHSMLAEMIIDRLGQDLNRPDSSKISSIYSPLMEYEELLLDAAGKTGAIRPNGFFRLAYRDEVDGTPQFCRAYLPLDYNPQKKWPLILQIHGYNGANPVYVRWWSVDSRHTSALDRYPVIYIEPHGRGNTSYHGIGEKDVLRCIELAKKYFNVDEDQIYLKGDSMGGGGTWWVGTRHPELFAAIAPIFGGWDYHIYMDEQNLARLTPCERFFQERDSFFGQADAMLTTPIYIFHGDEDKAVDVNQSRYAIKLLQRWGYDIRYHEFPGFGHEGLDIIDEVMPWFLSHKRNANPAKVRVRAAQLNSAAAHWVKITQRENPFAFIEAEVEVLAENTIRLSTENVLELELTPQSPLIDLQKPVTVVWNVRDIRKVRAVKGKFVLRAQNYKAESFDKTPAIEGPINHLTTTPFAVVIGTISSDTLMVKLSRQKAQDFIDGWKNWQKFEPRVFKDTEMKEADIQKYSLILYGDAKANLVAQKLGAKIPLKISSDQIEIGGKAFAVKDACVQMVYPHPLNSERYVTIIGATSGAGMYFYRNQFADYDFYIQDGHFASGLPHFQAEQVFAARGVFDYNWKIDPKFLESGDSGIIHKCPLQKVSPDLKVKFESHYIIDPALLHAFTGIYEIESGVQVEIFVEDSQLKARTPEGQVVQALMLSDLEFFVAEMQVRGEFIKDATGRVEALVVHQPNQDTKARKIE